MLLIGLPFLALGQDRYALHYKFKPQTVFSLDTPEEFLLPRALDRRTREGISADSLDLPVSPKYVEIITAMVEGIHYHSKWQNASVVVATKEQVNQIRDLPFIQRVDLVAKGFYPIGESGKKEVSGSPLNLKFGSRNTNAYDFQNDILGIPDMHAGGFTGEGVMIAVFDAGFLHADKISGMAHLFEGNNIVATKDFVLPGSGEVFRMDGHGTASLSVMASNEPGKLVSGAYDAQYILCITEDVESEYRIEEYNWVRAAEYADSLGADIINSSLGYNLFDDPEMNYSPQDLDGKTAVITQGAAIAAQKGILVVSSAGNEGNGSWRTVTAPADADGILAVGAVNNKLERSSFSSLGPTFDGRVKPDLVAFGSGVTIWRQVERPGASSGTSFSSPQIAALAAGLWQAKPFWTRQQLIENLLESGTMSDEPNMEIGFGIPNFNDAYYGKILDLEDSDEMIHSYIYPNPLGGEELYIHYGKDTGCDFRLINTMGQVVADETLTRSSSHNPYLVRLLNTPPGVYLIECRESRDSRRFRLLKK